jgi:hypothetical protein
MVIENPMVIDTLWDSGRAPKVVGECAGCNEDIYSIDEFYEMTEADGEIVYVHQTPDCCQHYVSERSICRGPEE